MIQEREVGLARAVTPDVHGAAVQRAAELHHGAERHAHHLQHCVALRCVAHRRHKGAKGVRGVWCMVHPAPSLLGDTAGFRHHGVKDVREEEGARRGSTREAKMPP